MVPWGTPEVAGLQEEEWPPNATSKHSKDPTQGDGSPPFPESGVPSHSSSIHDFSA